MNKIKACAVLICLSLFANAYIETIGPDFYSSFPLSFNQEELFDLVQDPNGIAIDIGASNVKAAIALSKKFSHVLAVESNKVILDFLQQNLQESSCSNVSICSRPLGATSEGEAITVKQLIHDYVLQKKIASTPVKFIKCDIAGQEEDIIEDLLYYAYYNKVKVYLSFHLEKWKSKKIEEFANLFKFFKSNCPSWNVCAYLKHNPSASLLLEPIESSEVLLKSNMPALIIGYNQPTFIKNMVKQLEKYTSDIIIVDNNSTFPKLLEYYEKEYKYTLLRQHKNFGHRVYSADHIQKLVGDVYILTDPDLQFNEKLPTIFIEKMWEVSQFFKACKVGFALCIDDPSIRTDIFVDGKTVQVWEAQWWKYLMPYWPDPRLKIYKASVDTTFCLVNRRYSNRSDYRIAGDFTCYHIPWHKDFKNDLEKDEYENYLINNISTTWFQ